jgi:hypothetical protein
LWPIADEATGTVMLTTAQLSMLIGASTGAHPAAVASWGVWGDTHAVLTRQ